ncbi:MAG: hypothetical protein KJZ85_12435 [Rhodobacteraceae bacterium]|jgi:hypothetical protein|nr:hypothetical protein [Paracoccaceae bacterium]
MSAGIAEAIAALDALRAAAGSGPVRDGTAPVPGIWFSLDAERGQTEGSYATRPGTMLDLRMHVVEEGRWLTLNLDTGTEDLSQRRLLGIYARSRASRAMAVRLALRIGHAEGFEDIPFPRQIVGFPETSTHVDHVLVAASPALRTEPHWRNLILWFPTGSFTFELEDLRLFMA